MSKPNRSNAVLLFFLCFLTFLGGYVRLAPVLMVKFPVNDGGLFFSMTQDLVANHFRLPVHTSYNNLQLPYAYPPLAFYLAGFLTRVFHLPLLDLFRILPALVSTLTIPVFFLLARSLLKSSSQVLLAVFLFAFLPSSFDWTMMGGGLTRGLGLFFSILSFWSLVRLYRQGLGWVTVLQTILFTALAILSHPEAALHTVTGALVFFLFLDRTRQGLLKSALTGGLTILVTAPWWGFVLSQHGAAPFLAAGKTGGYNLNLWLSFFQSALTNEVALTFVGCLAILGIFLQLAKKEYFLPVWLLVVISSEPRSAILHLTPCLALLAGLALDQVVLPRLREIESAAPDLQPRDALGQVELLLKGRVSKLLFLYLMVYFISASYAVAYAEVNLLSLSEENQQAFEWIRTNLPPAGRFAVITADQPLGDPAAEWFPTLTGQLSVATVQGYEWVLDQDFNKILHQSRALQLCAAQDAECVFDWQAQTGAAFEYIYLDKQRILEIQDSSAGQLFLQKSLLASNRFDLLYETPAVAILRARK